MVGKWGCVIPLYILERKTSYEANAKPQGKWNGFLNFNRKLYFIVYQVVSALLVKSEGNKMVKYWFGKK